MKISIIGSGFVGTAIGEGLIELNNEVIFYDVVDKNLPNFTFTKDINYAIENSTISFICVPTPTRANGEIELNHIREADVEVHFDSGNCLRRVKEVLERER